MNAKKAPLTEREKTLIRKKIEEELANKSFAGYMPCELHHMSFDAFVNYCTGQLLIAIGEGRFKQEMRTALSMAASWYAYQAKVREMEEAAGIK